MESNKKILPEELSPSAVAADYARQEQQAAVAIDAATEAAVAEVKAAQQQAERELQSQRDAVAVEEAQALDQSALYAELRGDEGGIGRAQYDSIQNTAARSRAEIARAQTSLATETAAKVASLRAAGEYEKAEKLLDLAQERLGAVLEIGQWAAEYDADQQATEAKLAQWQAEYELSAAKLTGYTAAGAPTADRRQELAALGEAMLKKGLLPNASQLTAMGMSDRQAREYLARQSSKSSSAAGETKAGAVIGTADWYAALYAAYGADAPLMLQYNYGKLGVSTLTAAKSLLEGYRSWYAAQAAARPAGAVKPGLAALHTRE